MRDSLHCQRSSDLPHVSAIARRQDGIEEFEGKDGSPLYWVSFLDGMQRILMFTADLAVATQAHNAGMTAVGREGRRQRR